MLVRCTKKTLHLLGRSIMLTEAPPSDDDWYLNVLSIDRHKCLLLTHTETLFSIFRARVRVAELRPIAPYLTAVIDAELRAEGWLRSRLLRSCAGLGRMSAEG